MTGYGVLVDAFVIGATNDRGPRQGWRKAEEFLNGVHKESVDLYTSNAHRRRLKTYSGLLRGTHTNQIKMLGQEQLGA